MPLEDMRVTSGLLWLSAFIIALLDIGMLLFLARRIQRSRFQRLQWPIVIAAAVFWMSYGLVLFALAWESFYARFLPDPARRSAFRSLLELLPYPVIGWGLWWLAGRLPGNGAVSFCLLGGVAAVPEHLWGIYRLGMLERVPFLQEASAAAVVGLTVPECILYWGSVLALAMVLQDDQRRRRNRILLNIVFA